MKNLLLIDNNTWLRTRLTSFFRLRDTRHDIKTKRNNKRYKEYLKRVYEANKRFINTPLTE